VPDTVPPWRSRLYDRIASALTFDPPRSRRFLVAAALAVAGALLRLLAGHWLGENALLAFSYPAVVIGAAYGGFGAGIVATLVSFVFGVLILGPALSVSEPPPAALRFLSFLAAGVVISVMSDLLRHGAGQGRSLAAERARRDEDEAKERARAFEKERIARLEAEASESRHRLLSEASALLASSKNHEADLGELARRLVPVFGRGCILQVVLQDGRVRRVATVHDDPRGAEALEALYEACSAGTGPAELARLLQADEPELVPEVGAWLARTPPGPERDLMERLDAGSALSVPLRARERPLGRLLLLSSSVGSRYDDEDLAFAADLGGRAGMALDNARLLAEAQRLNRVKDEFLAVLSHELRTPLGAILLWTGLLEAGSLEAAPARAVEMIDRSTRQLSQLIDELLDVSRIVAGKLSLSPHATNLPALLESVVEAARPAAEVKGLRLHLAVSGDFFNTWADSNRLRQALENVLLNAIKFTTEGEVNVSLQRIRRLARVRIQDSGAGIRPEVLPFVFERFRQGDSSSTRGQGGLGLGLAIAKHIVELHGGRIEAWSEGEDRGSAFTLEIPLSAPPTTPLQQPSGLRNADRPLSKRRVLVVDDHEDTLQGLTLALESSGAEVLSACSVRDGLRGLESFRPDVIVSDLAMPQEDGYDLIRAVRGRDSANGGGTPAVAVSAYASAEDRQRALGAGFQEHLAKPVDVSRLVETLSRLLRDVPPSAPSS
jgi:signal transduction histidine kinase/ActR/RegA family two-component response regulator